MKAIERLSLITDSIGFYFEPILGLDSASPKMSPEGTPQSVINFGNYGVIPKMESCKDSLELVIEETMGSG